MEYRFLQRTHVHNYDLPDIVDDVLTEPSVSERVNFKKAFPNTTILEETSFNAAEPKYSKAQIQSAIWCLKNLGVVVLTQVSVK